MQYQRGHRAAIVITLLDGDIAFPTSDGIVSTARMRWEGDAGDRPCTDEMAEKLRQLGVNPDIIAEAVSQSQA